MYNLFIFFSENDLDGTREKKLNPFHWLRMAHVFNHRMLLAHTFYIKMYTWIWSAIYKLSHTHIDKRKYLTVFSEMNSRCKNGEPGSKWEHKFPMIYSDYVVFRVSRLCVATLPFDNICFVMLYGRHTTDAKTVECNTSWSRASLSKTSASINFPPTHTHTNAHLRTQTHP